MFVLAVVLPGCYTATLVTLTPYSSPTLAVNARQGVITDADVERAKRIAKEIAAHFLFGPDTWPGSEEWSEKQYQLFHERTISAYASANGLGPVGISLHLPDNRSHLNVAINDLSHASGRTELVRLLQADFKRMFEEAFPDYKVEVK